MGPFEGQEAAGGQAAGVRACVDVCGGWGGGIVGVCIDAEVRGWVRVDLIQWMLNGTL
jgi:hypothetical protein